jgi:hypothetical protein
VIARVRVLGNRLAPCTHHAIKHRMPIFAVLLQGLLDTPATAKREAFWRGKALAVDAPGAKTHHRYKETWPPIANADAVDSPSWRVKSSRVEDLIALSWCCIYGAPVMPLCPVALSPVHGFSVAPGFVRMWHSTTFSHTQLAPTPTKHRHCHCSGPAIHLGSSRAHRRPPFERSHIASGLVAGAWRGADAGAGSLPLGPSRVTTRATRTSPQGPSRLHRSSRYRPTPHRRGRLPPHHRRSFNRAVSLLLSTSTHSTSIHPAATNPTSRVCVSRLKH